MTTSISRSNPIWGRCGGSPPTTSRFLSDFATIRSSTTDQKVAARVDDPHKFSIGAQTPGLEYAADSARFARLQYWPAAPSTPGT